MARRKVILHGPSTLTVSLPSRWVKKLGIKKGDEISIDEEGGQLRVYPGTTQRPIKKCKIDFTGLDYGAMHSLLSVLHKSGYDELEVSFDKADVVRIIQERINSMLLGYEIVEQGRTHCLIKSISNDSPEELNNLIRRCFLITLSLAKSSLEEFSRKREQKLAELLVLESTSNKLTNYCERLLNKQMIKDEKTIYAYLVVWILESIGDDYRDLIIQVMNKGSQKSDLVEGLKEVNACLQSYYLLFYEYSDLGLMEIRQAIGSAKKKLEKLNLEDHETHLISILNRIFDCLGSTAGLNH